MTTDVVSSFRQRFDPFGQSFATRQVMSEGVELEVRELLKSYGFPGDDVPVCRVSALKALNGDPLDPLVSDPAKFPGR